MILQEFDRQDRINVGRPNYFSVDDWLNLVSQYISADEVEKALWLLDNPPSWFTDHYPVRAKELRDRLFKQFFTTVDYAKDPVSTAQIGACDGDVPRGQIVVDYCKALNDQNIIPHVVECAPGNYWLAGLLERSGVKFTYYAETIDQDLQRRAQEKLSDFWSKEPGQHSIFVAFEFIEHISDTFQIYQSFLKNCPNARAVFLSTPRHCWGGGMANWSENALGHLRTYSPRQFHQFAIKYWPEFRWTLHDGHVMCLVGEK